jgi:hypothetical protein
LRQKALASRAELRQEDAWQSLTGNGGRS